MTAAPPAPPAPEAPPAPAVVRRPPTDGGPLVFATPHSGRLYPDDLRAASVLGDLDLRRSEDAFVDALIAGAPEHGATVVEAVYARAYVDVNRDPWELDPSMFADALPALARTQTARVAAGLGALARVVAEGQEIYGRKLTYAEAERRLAGVHRPYHAILTGALEQARARHGLAVLIDWHSMPTAAAKAEARRGRPQPDVVLGDRHGQSCARGLTAAVRRALEGMGYVVAVNSPYAGGWTTQTYGRPRDGVHALQIELDRRLYLDERTLEPSAGFGTLRRDLDRLMAELAARNWPQLLGRA